MSTATIPYRVEHNPAYASLIIDVPANKTVMVEASAMAAMDTLSLIHISEPTRPY